jgi:prolipoprotein diacylglyceryltransferase
MSAEQKVSSYVLTVTITLMAAAFAYIPQFHDIEQHPFTGILVAALTGTGLFEALAKLVELAFTKVRFIKKLILGPSYLEGCWSGFYIGACGQPRLVREFVRQDWSSVFINGQAFNADGTPHGQWRSVLAIVKGQEGLLRGDLVGDLESGNLSAQDGANKDVRIENDHLSGMRPSRGDAAP